MSSSTTAPAPAATTAVPPAPQGFPISEHAAQLSRIYIGATTVLMAFGTIAFAIRIRQRISPVWKVGPDDYFILLGFILTITDWAMLFPTMVPHPGLLPASRTLLAGKNSWLAIGIWGLSMGCIKISIALTLLRIQGSHLGWRIFLYTTMGVCAVYGVGNVFFNLLICCRPLEKAWNFAAEGQCVSFGVQRAVANTGAGINISTDILLSLAPATFLRKLNRPLRERVFVCVLMGMGLFASVSSIVKTVILKDYGNPEFNGDFWAMSVLICTWTALEQQLGLLAACVPAMKGVLQACLGAMGVSLTENKSGTRSGHYVRHGGPSGVSRTGGGDATGTYIRSQKGEEHPRFVSRRGRDMEDDETCIGLPDMSRAGSRKSLGRVQ